MSEMISLREGALVDTAGVALHGMGLSGITTGGTVVIIGPGPIGLIAMGYAKTLGATWVKMVGRGAPLDSAAGLGADEVINKAFHPNNSK